MIDLTKDQVLAEPVKCWVRNNEVLKWRLRWLVAIISEEYYTVDDVNHDIEVTLVDAFRFGVDTWDQCTLTDPAIPVKKIKKWLTVEDVPPELWGKALVKGKSEGIQQATIFIPQAVCYTNSTELYKDLDYLPLGQPLTGEWLPFESEVVE